MINEIIIRDTNNGVVQYSCQSNDPRDIINFLAWYIESNSGGSITVHPSETHHINPQEVIAHE